MDSALHQNRIAEVWARLSTVTDPELDEALTDLGFIEGVTIDDDRSVDVTFRLPTFWCSSNFAFLMADDIRQAVETLPWVSRARPLLQDHMTADEVNRGVEQGLSFGEVFSQFGATGTLEALRETFRRKAFERRQEAVILALRRTGHDVPSICAMDLQTLDGVDLTGVEGGEQKPRYRAILLERGLAADPTKPAFISFTGRRIEPAEFADHMGRLRGVRINMEFNSVLCRGLLDTRYKELDLNTLELVPQGGCGQRCGSACAKHAAA